MRGTLLHLGVDAGDRGIIPAYAGNTHSQIENELLRGDHPRVCGEHIVYSHNIFSHQGSSPRMRGTRFGNGAWIETWGIIPAYAGNTFTNLRLRKNTWDHPRVCGEHAFINGRRLPVKGSSPRMRGTPQS